ncbi:YibE/F family protein [Williamsia sp. 1138]|uniref:YibE/F family protein n=1 Tax=Williamsia sp. 1138 TaxID=1903117 RepID=UPI001FEE7BEA|nr:YibE/F family protein [Williamsia sp. 1138]
MSRASGPDETHQHGHSHGLVDVDLHPVVAKTVVGLLVASALAVIAGLIMLWPGDRDHDVPVIFQSSGGGSVQIETGQVVAQATADCLNPQSGKVFSGDPQVLTVKDGQCIQNTVALSSGPNEGANTLLEVPTNRVQAGVQQDAGSDELTPEQLAKPQAGQPDLSIGDEIKLSRSAGVDGADTYAYFDHERSTSVLVWALVFVAAIVLVASWRGLRSVIGLVFAFVVLFGFTLPAMLDGKSPVAVAIVSSAAILFVVIYLAHGVSLRTSAALLGTLVSLLLAGFLSWLSIETMNITGLGQDQTTNLQIYNNAISVDGILLAGFIIGALGVLNDVTITQASAVFELSAADGGDRLQTFTAAMRVGRDHIASTVYTLVFAYAGSTLPLLLLFSVSGQSFSTLITTDLVAVELARSFVGGIAIALSVPLTTAVAVMLTSTGKTAAPAQHEPTPQVAPRPRPPEIPKTRAPQPRAGGRHSLPE